MKNKHLGIMTAIQAKNLDRLSPEQYGSCKAKAADIQALNIRSFYDITRQKIIPVTSIFL